MCIETERFNDLRDYLLSGEMYIFCTKLLKTCNIIDMDLVSISARVLLVLVLLVILCTQSIA